MPRYSFNCRSADHLEKRHGAREFERVIQHGEGKRIDQCSCECGATAKRDFAKDIQTVAPIGLTPIAHSSRGKGTLAHETEFAFGRFKENQDGSSDKNHRPFRDSGELERYMNGANNLGPPVCDDNGNPIRRADGTMVRSGAKLFKYGPNATPSQDGVRKRPFRPDPRIVVDAGWGGERETLSAIGPRQGMSRDALRQVDIPTAIHRERVRKAKEA